MAAFLENAHAWLSTIEEVIEGITVVKQDLKVA